MVERLTHRLAQSLLLWDLALTLLCLYLASLLRYAISWGYDLPWTRIAWPWQLYLAVAVIWTTVFLLLTPQRRVFTSSLLELIGMLVTSVGLSSLTFAGLLYLSFRDVSRLQFIYFAALNLVVLLLFHLLARAYVRSRQARTSRRVLFVGAGPEAQHLARELGRHPWSGFQVVGFTSNEPVSSKIAPVLGMLAQVPNIVVEEEIDELIFALPPQEHEQVVRISLKLQHHAVMMHMVPGVLDLAFARTAVGTLGGIPLISLRESALTEPQRLIKRGFDVAVSAALLVLFSPLMLVLACLIKLESPGPILFRQQRIGAHGQRFTMYKFRSMYADAEQRWQEVARRNAAGTLQHKHTDDPRITQVGMKLRRMSLDELPQLWNVLWGEMSLVGPRPEMPYVAAEYEPWQWQRFRVPPGMTGWWQVNGRSDRPMHQHTEDDLYYIQNYSFWLDLQILIKTIPVVFSRHGAY